MEISPQVKIIINGPPASGKSTQATFLVQRTQAALVRKFKVIVKVCR